MQNNKSKIHPVDVYVGARVREARNLMGLSQDSLATSIGITFQQIQKYERGINRLSSSKLHEISKILKVPVGDFFKGVEEYEARLEAERTSMPYIEPEDTQLPLFPASGRSTQQVVHYLNKIKNERMKKGIVHLLRIAADDEP